MLSGIELYRVKVNGAAKRWSGLFIEMPDSQQIEEALRLDIAELDLEIEHENDQANDLCLLLEIIPLYDPANGDNVSVAGVFIGEVTIESIQGFGELPIPLVDIAEPWQTSPVAPGFPIHSILNTGLPKQSVIDGGTA